MNHDFTKHSLKKLILLRGDMLQGISNPANLGKIEAMEKTVEQINAELESRGINPLREILKPLA